MTVANPDLPDRALPAAWRLLRAVADHKPCAWDPDEQECRAHQYFGFGASELRRELGVQCLAPIVHRVVEAEEAHDQERQKTAAARFVMAGPPPSTLGDLWRATDNTTAGAHLVRTALAMCVADDTAGLPVGEWQKIVEKLVRERVADFR